MPLIQAVLERETQLTDSFTRAMRIAQSIRTVLNRVGPLIDAFKSGG